MGFNVTVSLFGLPLLTWYVTISGSFQINKQLGGSYIINYAVQYKTAINQPMVNRQERCFCVSELPDDLWVSIYNNIKKSLDPLYDCEGQTLQFVDC
jgi:hypothetical protein